MNDREKVISGLGEIYTYFHSSIDAMAGGTLACEAFARYAQVANDALDLLKAQDETRLVRHYSRPNVYADLWLHCEKCGECVDDNWHPKYCPGCGRMVKWDD